MAGRCKAQRARGPTVSFLKGKPLLMSCVSYTHGMSKRLQILVDDHELADIRAAASQQGMTMSEWVRHALRTARRQHADGDTSRKLAVVRAAASHRFPTADIDQMLEEIERGYRPT